MNEPPAILIVGHRADAHVQSLHAVAERSGRTVAIWPPGSPDGDAALDRAGQDGAILPVVLVSAAAAPASDAIGSETFSPVVLIDPTDLDLIEELGFPRARAHTEGDLVVIGAGLAGLAAAVGGAAYGLRTLVVDPTLPGGSLDKNTTIPDYLGFPGGVLAADLVQRAVDQARRVGVVFLLTERVEEILDHGDGLLLVLTSGATASCRAAVVATGEQRRPAVELALPGVVVAATAPHDAAAVAVGSGAAAAGRARRYLEDAATRL